MPADLPKLTKKLKSLTFPTGLFETAELDQDYSAKYISALEWVNYNFEMDELKHLVLEYLKNEKSLNVDKFQEINDWYFVHAGKVCYLLSIGFPLRDSTIQFLDQKIKTLIEMSKDFKATVLEEKTKVTQAQVKLNAKQRKTQTIIADIEELVDVAVFDEAALDDYGVYNYLIREKVDTSTTNDCLKYFKDIIDKLDTEIREIPTDNRLEESEKERYIEEIDEEIAVLENVLIEINCYLGNTKASRGTASTRSKKVKNQVEKVIKTAKFKIHDKGLKIQSIGLDRIIGSHLLVTYNTKNRKLSLYESIDESGLTIKGTTILNFNTETSEQKTVKDPDKILTRIQKSDEYCTRKAFSDRLTTKSSTPNGRLNNDTILLKAFTKK